MAADMLNATKSNIKLWDVAKQNMVSTQYNEWSLAEKPIRILLVECVSFKLKFVGTNDPPQSSSKDGRRKQNWVELCYKSRLWAKLPFSFVYPFGMHAKRAIDIYTMVQFVQRIDGHD